MCAKPSYPQSYLPPADQESFGTLLHQSGTTPARLEVSLKRGDGRLLPALVSASRLQSEGLLPRELSATTSTAIKPVAAPKRTTGAEATIVVEDEEALLEIARRPLVEATPC